MDLFFASRTIKSTHVWYHLEMFRRVGFCTIFFILLQFSLQQGESIDQSEFSTVRRVGELHTLRQFQRANGNFERALQAGNKLKNDDVLEEFDEDHEETSSSDEEEQEQHPSTTPSPASAQDGTGTGTGDVHLSIVAPRPSPHSMPPNALVKRLDDVDSKLEVPNCIKANFRRSIGSKIITTGEKCK